MFYIQTFHFPFKVYGTLEINKWLLRRLFSLLKLNVEISLALYFLLFVPYFKTSGLPFGSIVLLPYKCATQEKMMRLTKAGYTKTSLFPFNVLI